MQLLGRATGIGLHQAFLFYTTAAAAAAAAAAVAVYYSHTSYLSSLIHRRMTILRLESDRQTKVANITHKTLLILVWWKLFSSFNLQLLLRHVKHDLQ